MKKLRNSMYEIGGRIMESEEFQSSYSETHHKASSVGVHSEAVACECLRLCRILKFFRMDVDEKAAVEAALCHDLGMLGRNEKYISDKECHRLHPQESLEVARKLIPDMSPEVEDAIVNHMWPITKQVPKSRIGKVLVVADKLCSMGDVRHIARKRGLALMAGLLILLPKI